MFDLQGIKYSVRNLFKKLPGWNTDRKIIVFESDDWGSIRMPSKDVYGFCLEKGYAVDRSIYTKYDSIASEDDLTLLFNLLSSYTDLNGNHPVFTFNCLAANPDFEKIKNSDFNEYHFELITDTFKRYPKHSGNWKLWQDAIKAGIIKPQSHGREHLNVSRFMSDLKQNVEEARFAFDLKMPGIFLRNNISEGNSYIVPLEHSDREDLNRKIEVTNEGLRLFNELFGEDSLSYIAGNYIWHPDIERTLHQRGVRYIQGGKNQLVPAGKYEGFTKIPHYLGQVNDLKQVYLIRNAQFEPSTAPGSNWVDLCLSGINRAFNTKKPAIVCTHRINYVGYIDVANRDRTLAMLDQLLKKIIKKWPDVEFMSSDRLGEVICDTIEK